MKLSSSKSILKVKEKYEMEWMKIPGVEGVGITGKKGQETIVIYTSNKQSVRKKIPSKIEGIPIVLETTGSFTAF